MCGRGIDQMLAHSVDPALHEPSGISARDYVRLAERRNGPIARPLSCAAMWGHAAREWRRRPTHARIINLETALTTSDDWQDKGINYRAHPANVQCLRTAGVDACALANNHVLDWGRAGLLETLAVLRAAGLRCAGAGIDAQQAAAPALLPGPDGTRTLLFAAGLGSSGIPPCWRAGTGPGVNLLDGSRNSVEMLAERIAAQRAPGDTVVLSIHWGGNWGYALPQLQRRFAHALIDEAGVDVIHGHSSHHPLPVEVYRGKPILYGCGDFLNDYEGIGGYEDYRPDLCLMYFLSLNRRRNLSRLHMVPLRIRGFRLHRAGADDALWLCQRLTQQAQSCACGTQLSCDRQRVLRLHWRQRTHD